MAETPEHKVKRKIRELLAQYPVYLFMPVQAGYGARTLDILGCINGRFFAIEAKAPGKKMTEQQCLIANSMRSAGAVVFCISGWDQGTPDWVALESWLHSVSAESKAAAFTHR